MSLEYCPTHDRKFDTDEVESCALCPPRCHFRNCNEPAVGCCENRCDARFCEDHGSKGGDRYCGPMEYHVTAFPDLCWQHGGYNADE